MEGERGANSVKPKGYEPPIVYRSRRNPVRHSIKRRGIGRGARSSTELIERGDLVGEL